MLPATVSATVSVDGGSGRAGCSGLWKTSREH